MNANECIYRRYTPNRWLRSSLFQFRRHFEIHFEQQFITIDGFEPVQA